MLAYVFWHRPAADTDRGRYEEAQRHLHRSLAARPPEGYHGSTLYRAAELPWLAPAGEPGYEDWYLIDDWTALGVLREAAVSTGHRSVHDDAARHAVAGTGAVYRLCEGDPHPPTAPLTVWVVSPPGHPEDGVTALLLGDGLDQGHGGLWRRELALGPAGEYCLLVDELPAGAGAGRLPAGWRADAFPRELLYPAR